jgi:phytoene synthase
MNPDAIRLCYDSIRVHSRSFALASRLLPPVARDRGVAVYAWCRRADDAVDLAAGERVEAALKRLRAELEDIYAGRNVNDPFLAAFQSTVHECGIPRLYPEELLKGMEMDVMDTRYEAMETLLRYCYCVAGTVGLMMCHVMGVTDERATRNATHMGMAMQLTNICRDVLEDWNRNRLYIPESVLAQSGNPNLAARLGEPFPETAREPVARATAFLLDEADRYYQSGDAGLRALSWRCALSVSTARRVYSAIGARVRAAGCDPLAGRAIVPTRGKLALAASALVVSLADLPRRAFSSAQVATPRRQVSFPGDVLPV